MSDRPSENLGEAGSATTAEPRPAPDARPLDPEPAKPGPAPR
jgi:hypothetical protein